MLISEYILGMARAATTTDVFNAIAEPRRRQIIDALGHGAHAVGELVSSLQMGQPTVSKHLGVLRKVGVVSVSRQGKRRLYQLNPRALKPVGDWVKTYERFWSNQFDRIKELAEQKARERAARQGRQSSDPEE